jgi:hypothetical protein
VRAATSPERRIRQKTRRALCRSYSIENATEVPHSGHCEAGSVPRRSYRQRQHRIMRNCVALSRIACKASQESSSSYLHPNNSYASPGGWIESDTKRHADKKRPCLSCSQARKKTVPGGRGPAPWLWEEIRGSFFLTPVVRRGPGAGSMGFVEDCRLLSWPGAGLLWDGSAARRGLEPGCRVCLSHWERSRYRGLGSAKAAGQGSRSPASASPILGPSSAGGRSGSRGGNVRR